MNTVFQSASGSEFFEIAKTLWESRQKFYLTGGLDDRAHDILIFEFDKDNEFSPKSSETMLQILGMFDTINNDTLREMLSKLYRIFNHVNLGRYLVDMKDLLEYYLAYDETHGREEADDLVFWANEMIFDYDDLSLLLNAFILEYLIIKNAPVAVINSLELPLDMLKKDVVRSLKERWKSDTI